MIGEIKPPALVILDVGHGNSAVLIEPSNIVVIDAGPRSGLLQFLHEQKINVIDTVLISHADQDHIDGLIALLSSGEFVIKKVRLNTDSSKCSVKWDELLYELSLQQDEKLVDFQTQLTRGQEEQYTEGDVQIEIAGPSTYLTGKGPGSKDREGRQITSNSISALIRVKQKDKKIALFPGDVDVIGIEDIESRGIDIRASILVFPHHGGRAGATTDMASFARKMCELVEPKHVVFSFARREKPLYPRPEIVSAILDYNAHIRISCTQLSSYCTSTLPEKTPSHIGRNFAQGKESNRCCSGTIIIDLTNESVLPSEREHTNFVLEFATTALCRRHT